MQRGITRLTNCVHVLYTGSQQYNQWRSALTTRCKLMTLAHKQHKCRCDANSGSSWHQTEAFGELNLHVHRKRLHDNNERT